MSTWIIKDEVENEGKELKEEVQLIEHLYPKHWIRFFPRINLNNQFYTLSVYSDK